MGIIWTIIFMVLACCIGFSAAVFVIRKIVNKRAEALSDIIQKIKNGEEPNAAETVLPQNIAETINSLSRTLSRREKNRSEILNLLNFTASSIEIEQLLETLMPKLLESSQSNWGAFYLANNATNKLELKCSFGFSKEMYSEFDINIGEGFIGLAAYTRKTQLMTNIPEDSIFISRTFLGKMVPRNLIFVPIIHQDILMGVLVLGSVYEYTAEQLEIIDIIKYYVGAAISNGVIYERNKRLTNEMRFQNKLIQDLNAELETKITDHNLFLSTILDSLTGYAVYSTDKDGGVLSWSAGAEILFGYSASEMIGKNVSFLYSIEEIEAGVLKRRTDAIKRDGKYETCGWIRKTDGTANYVDETSFAIYNQKGEFVGMANIARDVTEIKAKTDELVLEKEMRERMFEYSDRGCFIVINDNFRIERVNDAARERFRGVELEGYRFFDFFEETNELKDMFATEASASGARKACQITAKNGDKFDVELLGVGTDGKRILKVIVVMKF
ncbi:hypothetical protein FACS189490_09940 [Clostridia bacterium]|nr:hypothetical protein FACS189490_09940 [Clostridia bacterium]